MVKGGFPFMAALAYQIQASITALMAAKGTVAEGLTVGAGCWSGGVL